MPQAESRRAHTLAMILDSYASKDRLEDFTFRRSWFGPRLDIHSVECAKALLLRRTQRRFGPFAALVGNGFGHRVMIVADGEEWRRTHEAIVPHLHAAAAARDYLSVVQRVAAAAFGDLVERSRGGGGATTVLEIDTEALMRSVTASVMGHIVFGESLSLNDARYLERILGECTEPPTAGVAAGLNLAVAYALRLLGQSHRQHFWLPTGQRRAVAELFDWIGSRIDATAETGASRPLLRSLESRYADRRTVERRRCVAAECAMIFIAGIETTAAALAFAIAEIAHDAQIRDSVTEEARQRVVASKEGRRPNDRFSANLSSDSGDLAPTHYRPHDAARGGRGPGSARVSRSRAATREAASPARHDSALLTGQGKSEA